MKESETPILVIQPFAAAAVERFIVVHEVSSHGIDEHEIGREPRRVQERRGELEVRQRRRVEKELQKRGHADHTECDHNGTVLPDAIGQPHNAGNREHRDEVKGRAPDAHHRRGGNFVAVEDVVDVDVKPEARDRVERRHRDEARG